MLLRNRYLRLRRREDIDTAVQLLSGELNDDDHRDPARLTNLGNALLTRFETQGDPNDLARAGTTQLRAVELTCGGDWQLASRHNNAANALATTADEYGDDNAAQAAVEHYRAALALTPTEAHERASREYNLALRLELGDEADRAEAVQRFRNAVRSGLNGSHEWALAAAMRWGAWASSRGSWSEACEAYGYALDLVHRLFQVQLLRMDREAWLVESQGLAARAALALARVDRGREAATALEAGSALLLADALQIARADVDRLDAAGRSDLSAAYVRAAGAVDRSWK